MIAIISLLVILTFSILITRIASIALAHTGLSREAARFQARSAFTGVGFTTNESEKVVNHPVRRRILLILMLLGNVGIVTVVSSLILTFISPENSQSLYIKLSILIAGILLLWWFSQSQWVDKRLSVIIRKSLDRHTQLDITDYASLLNLAGDYRVYELHVEAKDWIVNKMLKETRLRDEGTLVLGIERKDGEYIGAPRGETKMLMDDTLILYGRKPAIEALDQRRKGISGDKEHKEAVEEQKKIEQQQEETPEKQSEKISREVRS